MSLVLNVEILGEFKKLTEATKGSEKSLSGLEDNAKKISKGINTALTAIGIGFSLNFLVDQFKESTKAAIEDEKSKVLLNKALQDNLKISNQQADAIDKYITRTQLATSVTDDKLRPAFAKLAISTKDTDQAMRLMNIALDVSAGTGKNLDAVVQAMSRSLAGSDTALTRLVPSIKGADDPMKALEETFRGAAEAAANTDPYAKMQIIFGEMQEQIGTALLPVLTKFSEWLSTPEGQEKLQAIVDGIVDVVEWFGQLAGFISDKVMPALEMLTGESGFGAVISSITALVASLAVIKVALMIFTAGNPVLAGIVAGLGLIAGAMYLIYQRTNQTNTALAEFNRLQGIQRVTSTPFTTPEQIAAETYQGIIPQLVPKANVPKPRVDVPAKPGSLKVDINATIDGNSVIKQINNQLKSQGSSLRIQ